MTTPNNMLGESIALAEALDHLSLLAGIHRPVLVLGERGTGKELAAERLHFLSPRWDAPFLRVNCAAMAETLLESELFGHEAGAFTGATRQHAGRFERADGGTLLLDEIGTMSLPLQEKLLRLIEYGEFERVGGQQTLTVDVRVVGATNADLRTMAQRGAFRADLLDRLSFDVVHLPPLRERDRDVLLLAEHFAMQMSSELGWELFPGFSPHAADQLQAHDWPGNVRELKNTVERSLHRWGDETRPVAELILDPFESPWSRDEALMPASPQGDDSTPGHGASDEAPGLREAVEAYERSLLLSALARNEHNQRKAAEDLGLSYDQIRGLVRKHGITGRRRGAAFASDGRATPGL
ncbi:MAG: phage shock protein operon transcriptional activator [Halieaceae bacterium]|nr:phage shock protein operon transcriptional activator [Halieaceae bacterium]